MNYCHKAPHRGLKVELGLFYLRELREVYCTFFNDWNWGIAERIAGLYSLHNSPLDVHIAVLQILFEVSQMFNINFVASLALILILWMSFKQGNKIQTWLLGQCPSFWPAPNWNKALCSWLEALLMDSVVFKAPRNLGVVLIFESGLESREVNTALWLAKTRYLPVIDDQKVGKLPRKLFFITVKYQPLNEEIFT